MANQAKFWLVWSPQGTRPPQCRHASRRSAITEAHRLASLHPGSQFYVLEAVGVAKKVDVEWTELDAEIPF